MLKFVDTSVNLLWKNLTRLSHKRVTPESKLKLLNNVATQPNNVNKIFVTKYASLNSSNNINATALVLIAEGAEELETTSIIDVLRRGDVCVTLAGIPDKNPVKCRSGTIIWPDVSLKCAMKQAKYDAVILPGGLGAAKVFAENSQVCKCLKEQETNKSYIGAICAAPVALKAHCIGVGKHITSYPGKADELKKSSMYTYLDCCDVVCDGKLITSRGPGTAIIFSLIMLEKLQGKECASQVACDMLYHDYFDYCCKK